MKQRKVDLLQAGDTLYGKVSGREYTITGILDGEPFCEEVGRLARKHLKLTPATRAAIAARRPAAPLAVGDRVEVTGPDCRDSDYWLGRVATVDQIDAPPHRWPYAVMLEGVGRAWFPASSLRRIPPATDRQPAAPAEQPAPTAAERLREWQ